MNFKELTYFLDGLVNKIGIPGIDCVVLKEHDMVYRHFAGYKDVKNKRKIEGNEIYNFYSPTKIITVVSALQLVEKGLLSLDDPVYEFIPEARHLTYLKDIGNGKTEISETRKVMTVKHLFTMTAGFDYDIHKKEIVEVEKKTDNKAPTQEVIRTLVQTPLLFEPGEHWNYSLCHDVLGAVIEIVSGKKLSEYMKENVFLPLGMSESGFKRDYTKSDRFALQYFYDDEEKKAKEMTIENDHVFGSEYESGGAGLISTVDDYLKFAETMTYKGLSRSGTRILSEKYVDILRTNQLSEKQLPDLDWIQLKGYGYGLGVRTLMDPKLGNTLSTIGEFGWSGAGGMYVSMDPTKKLTILYAQHMRNNLEPYVHPRLRNQVYKALLS